MVSEVGGIGGIASAGGTRGALRACAHEEIDGAYGVGLGGNGLGSQYARANPPPAESPTR